MSLSCKYFLCLYHVSISSFIFSLSVWLKLLKHIKLTVFESIMNVNKTSVFDKKARFDKKNSDMAEKEHWWPKRGIYYCGHWRRLYHWELKENPITEDPKENPINEKHKEDTITLTPIDNSINEDIQELQDLQWLLLCKLIFFSFGNGIW